MRIVFVTHYGYLYGANRSLLTLIEELRSRSVESFVIAPELGSIKAELEERRIPHIVCPFKTWMSSPEHHWKRPIRLLYNLTVLPYLALRVQRWDPDLIHSNSVVTPIGALLSEALGLPHTWHIREFGDLDYGLEPDLGHRVFRWALGRSSALIPVSKAVRKHLAEGVDVPAHVVYNGVVTQRQLETYRTEFDDEMSSESRSRPYTFAMLGRIRPSKGQEQAIRALHHLREEGRNVRLLLAGEGELEYEQSLKKLSQSLGISDSVSLLGFVEEPFDVYQQADAVLMCSPNEAMGRVTAESMAAVRPVIGYDSGGTAELIEDGENGLLYDGTTSDLERCMRQCSENPSWSRELGRNGWERARENYTSEVYAEKVFNIMKAVVQ
jgi:glycosyltransferase involved in cell wall biosynthesis